MIIYCSVSNFCQYSMDMPKTIQLCDMFWFYEFLQKNTPALLLVASSWCKNCLQIGMHMSLGGDSQTWKLGQIWPYTVELNHFLFHSETWKFNATPSKFTALPKTHHSTNAKKFNNLASQRSLDCADQIWSWSSYVSGRKNAKSCKGLLSSQQSIAKPK